jgi:uncharacterized repeat protein (TIGR02543 family)
MRKPVSTKRSKSIALLSILILLGTVISVPAYAGDSRSQGNDRGRRVIELANPTNVVVTPAATSLAISFNAVANASSYTVRVYQATGERLVGSARTNFNSGNSVTGLTASTDYRVSVQAIGNGTTYASSEEPRLVRTRTTAPANRNHMVTWLPSCPISCTTPATGGASSYTEGIAITSLPSAPTAPLSTFNGWIATTGNASPSGGGFLPTSPYVDIVFTGQWIANTHSVTWNSNCPPSTPCTTASGGATTYTEGFGFSGPTPPSATGWNFTGWLATTGTAQQVQPLSINQFIPLSPYIDIVFTAQWSPLSYTVTWDHCRVSSLGACSDATGGSTSYSAGSTITSPTANPSSPGYIFTGWTSNLPAVISDPSTATAASLSPLSPYGNLIFTPKWGYKTYTIILNDACIDKDPCSPGAIVSPTMEPLSPDASSQLPTSPTATGWNFTYYDGIIDEESSTITLTALWESVPSGGPVTHKIFWIPNCPGGCELLDAGPTFVNNACQNTFCGYTTYTEGEAIGYVPQPSLVDGYGFNGWYNQDNLPEPDWVPIAPYRDIYFAGNEWNSLGGGMFGP